MSEDPSTIGMTVKPKSKSTHHNDSLMTHTQSYNTEKQKYLNRWFEEDERNKDTYELLRPKTRRPQNTKSISNIERIKRPNNVTSQPQQQTENKEEKYVKPAIKYPPHMSQATKDQMNVDWVTRLTTTTEKRPTKETKQKPYERDFETFILRQNESARRRLPNEPLHSIHKTVDNAPRCYITKKPDFQENQRSEEKKVFKGKSHLQTTYDSTARDVKRAAIQIQMENEQQSKIDAMSQSGRSVSSRYSQRSKNGKSTASVIKDTKTFDDIVADYRNEREMRRYL